MKSGCACLTLHAFSFTVETLWLAEDVCGFGQDIDDVYKVSQAVRDAADTVRKLGRLLETFFDRLADLFSQASVKPDDSVLSCDDLSQIVQEYVASITKLRALEG